MARTPLRRRLELRRDPILRLVDSRRTRLSSSALAHLGSGRNRPSAQEAGRFAALAEQFLALNRTTLEAFEIVGQVVHGEPVPALELTSGCSVGAVALRSPLTGTHDLGLVVQPRFEWTSVGAMLGRTGWRVIPTLLASHALPRTEREIPPWVLSSIVLLRLDRLLRHLERRFEMVEADHAAPRGQVRWTEYAVRRVPRALLTSVPCRHPDLRDDEQLRGAIHAALRRQISSLSGQRGSGPAVFGLLQWAESLLQEVRDAAPRFPRAPSLAAWLRRPLAANALRDGVEAIEWTADERGLAGTSDLSGLPWRLRMDEFFESWVETVAAEVSRRTGARLLVGRRGETTTRIDWSPRWVGSQGSLRPDLVLETDSRVVIVDAKYKAHWERLAVDRRPLADAVREEHRADLLQILAYASLFPRKAVTACLVYPSDPRRHDSLRARGLHVLRGSVRAGERDLSLALASAPMVAETARFAGDLAAMLVEGDHPL